MKLNRTDLLLYPVIGSEYLVHETLLSSAKKMIIGGAKIIQLREKNMTDYEFLEEAKLIKQLCDEYSVKLIINDNLEIAKAINAAGVHIGQNDISAVEAKQKLEDDFIIGVSVGSVEEAKAAAKYADYLGVGAMYATNTKKDAKIISKKNLIEICNNVDIPVVAIGGINANNIKDFKNINIAGIAMVNALVNSYDIEQNTRYLKRSIEYYLKNKIHTTLTIAGSDSSGGAGIQADLKTMLANGVYGMSAITAITAQNTQGVKDILELPSKLVSSQLDAIFEDIYPDSVKIGMVSNVEIITIIAKKLKEYSANNIVVDPVMVSTSGCVLINDDAIKALKDLLFPLATLITPNIYEAEILSGIKIKNNVDMEQACKIIFKSMGCNVLLKGGHCVNDANDVLYDGKAIYWFKGERINNDNTHGTGCTLSSAIASNLAKGYDLVDSIKKAKKYLSNILKSDINLGEKSGPLNHGYEVIEYEE